MKRIDRIKKTYGVEFYFCTKYYKFYEYISSPYFRPTAREINENYPPSVKSTPSSFQERRACGAVEACHWRILSRLQIMSQPESSVGANHYAPQCTWDMPRPTMDSQSELRRFNIIPK
ncbi:hypothetical protein NKR23_g12453, partial [Pleurostoma richardsiae]